MRRSRRRPPQSIQARPQTQSERRHLQVTVNGARYEADIEPRTLLVHLLREQLGFMGVRVGCVEGRCGACTVILSGETVKSCLVFAVQAEGAEILTVEGLAKGGRLHPLQEAFWENHALQCGYCTPGFLMSTYSLLQRNPKPTEEEVRIGISGNLCMCTGYVNIVKAVLAAATRLRRE